MEGSGSRAAACCGSVLLLAPPLSKVSAWAVALFPAGVAEGGAKCGALGWLWEAREGGEEA